VLGGVEKVADAVRAEHVGDLVRIADGGCDPARQHATVELRRGHQRGFDVEVRVDEAWDGEQPAPVDLLFAVICTVGADDAVAADGDIGPGNLSRHQIEQPDIGDDEVGRFGTAALPDSAGEKGRRHSAFQVRAKQDEGQPRVGASRPERQAAASA